MRKLTLTLLLFGCPPPPTMPLDAGETPMMDAGAGPVALTNCAAWASAECDWRTRCFGATTTACLTALQERCVTASASVERSVLGYDPMKAATCASQGPTRACDASLACSPFTVTAALGAACLAGFDCGEGQECGGLTCPATCQRATLGAPCGTFECVEGTCDRRTGFCRATNVPGRACTGWWDCGGGLACLSTGGGLSCGALPMRGQPCSTDLNDPRRCRDEDFCDAAGSTCVARLALGATCSAGQCVSGTSCENGTCTATTPGSRCDLDLECPSGTRCLSNRCDPPPAMHGAACSPTSDCLAPQLVCGQVSSQCIERTRPLADQELCDPRVSACAAGLVCEEVARNDWRCRRHTGRQAGISCSANEQCESSVCAGNQCAAFAGANQSCTDAPCLPGFGCINGTCVGAGLLGTRCLAGDVCTEGACVGGSCAPPTAEGASCTASGDCASGRCRDGHCLAACTTK